MKIDITQEEIEEEVAQFLEEIADDIRNEDLQYSEIPMAGLWLNENESDIKSVELCFWKDGKNRILEIY